MSSLLSQLYSANLVIDDSAFTWGRSFWQSDKSYSQFLNSQYDAAKLPNSYFVTGTKKRLPANDIVEYYNGYYQTFFSLTKEYADFKHLAMPLSDYLVHDIVTTQGATSLTLSTAPSVKFPFLLIHKFFEHYTIFHQRYTSSAHQAFTFARSGTALSNINPGLGYTVTESITFPKVSDVDTLEIQLSCFPIVPGTLDIAGYTESEFEIDYFYGIIRSAQHFPTTTATVNVTYETGVGAIYVPEYVDELILTHPISTDNLAVGSKFCIKDI